MKKTLRHITTPTDLIICGSADIIEQCDVCITDDYCDYSIRVNGERIKHKNCACDGRISILTVEEYIKQLDYTSQNIFECNFNDIRLYYDSFLLKDFVGDIDLTFLVNDKPRKISDYDSKNMVTSLVENDVYEDLYFFSEEFDNNWEEDDIKIEVSISLPKETRCELITTELYGKIYNGQ